MAKGVILVKLDSLAQNRVFDRVRPQNLPIDPAFEIAARIEPFSRLPEHFLCRKWPECASSHQRT